MQRLILSSFICTTLMTGRSIEASDETDKIEAGCKRWKPWRKEFGEYGELIQKGACRTYGYDMKRPPGTNGNTVLSTIEELIIRDIDAQKKTLTVDFSLNMRWWDFRIKTNFLVLKEGLKEIPIDNQWANRIWKPDVYVYNLSNYKAFKDSMQYRSFRLARQKRDRKIPFEIVEILYKEYGKNLTEDDLQVYFQADVELTLEATANTYCTFDLPRYPFDKQKCEFRLGSRSFISNFILLDPEDQYHNTVSYQASNFFTTTTFVNGTKGAIGVDILMSRDIQSFVLKYYVSCIAIVILSNFSFVIPLSDVSGRVALLVTLFLTLTNLFIYQMVIIYLLQYVVIFNDQVS